jgi:phosphoesterase RecJ-like protein
MLQASAARSFRSILRRGKNFAVVCHSLPDGDAAGSAAALRRHLLSLGKRADVVNATPRDEAFEPFFGKRVVRGVFGRRGYDAVVVLDCGDYRRSGLEQEIRRLSCPVVNVDHHMTNTMFGDLNVVDKSAHATCEILFDLLAPAGLTARIAEPLLHGMLTDTRIFQVYDLGPAYFRKVASLLDTGLSYDRFYSRITQSNSLDSLKALFKTMAGLRNSASGKVVWTLIPEHDEAAGSFDLIHFQLLELLLSIREACLVFVAFDKGPAGVHVELRSKKPFKAVRPALALGGGGHSFASGCQLRCSLAEAERRVLAAVRGAYPRLLESKTAEKRRKVSV